MDSDKDNLLKYRDFCNLCAEQMLHEAPSLGDTSISGSQAGRSKATSEFSNIIQKLKSNKPTSGALGPNRGRGGPNFTRGKSAGTFQAAKDISQLCGDQPFVSTELHRFMVNMQDLPLGHGVHTPMNNRFDAIRDGSVYNSVGGGSDSQSWTRTSAASSLNKLRNKLQQRTHGMTSEMLST